LGTIRFDRVPPQNIDAERAVLGACLLPEGSTLAVIKIIDIIRSEHFYKEAHSKIWSAIILLFERNQPIDLVTVTRQLEAMGDLEKVGDVAYLDEMMDSVPTAANIEYYAEIVVDESKKRNLINAAVEIYNDAFNATESTASLIDNAESKILKIGNSESKTNTVAIKEALKVSLKEIEAASHNQGEYPGYKFGWIDVDKLLEGVERAEYVVVAGRPGMGKSMFVQNIATNLGVEKVPVGIFSLEMSYHNIIKRMLSSNSNIPFNILRLGAMIDSQWPKLTLSASNLYNMPLFIDDSRGITDLQLRAKIRRMKHEHGIEVVIIDYAQLLSSNRRYDNRAAEMTEVSKNLAGMAHDFNVLLIVCAQLNRMPDGRSDKRPMLSDLKESGSYEQDADRVIFLYRGAYYTKDKTDNIVEVIVEKNRNGATGMAKLLFQPECMRFLNLDTKYKAERFGQ